MALDPKKIAELEAKLKSIEEYSRQLGKNINTINLKPLEQNAGAIEAIFEQLNKEMEDLGGSTDYLVSEFSRLTSEIRNTSAGVKQSTNSMRELSSIAQKLSNHQKGYNDLSKAELDTLSKKVKQEYSSLSNSLKALQMEFYLSFSLWQNSFVIYLVQLLHLYRKLFCLDNFLDYNSSLH